MVSVLLSYGSQYILHVLLCHVTVFMLYDWGPLWILLDTRSCYMYYCSMLLYSCYMIVSWYWYGYSRYWTWELLICYMWTSTSIDPVSRYIVPVILILLSCSWFPLYCSMLSTELWSSYHVTRITYCNGTCYIVYLTYQIIKLTWVWGRLDGWLDLIGWCTGSILLVPLQGTVVLPTNSSMSSRYLIRAPLLAEGPGLSSQGSV